MEIVFEGIDLVPYQEEFLYTPKRFSLVDASTKAGKGSLLTAKVYTPDGFKLMGDIRPGDSVLSKDGISIVKEIFPLGEVPSYKITFSDRSSTIVSEDHLWLIDKSYSRRAKNPDDVRAKVWPRLMTTKDLLGISEGQRRHYKIPMCSPVQFKEREVAIDPYLLGILIGDGNLTNGTVAFTTSDEDIYNEVFLRCPDGYKIIEKCQNNYLIVSKYKTIVNGSLISKIRNYGLDCLSYEKHIPEDYKYNTVEVRKEILRGIFDADGWVNKHGQIVIDQTSEQLAKDISEVVQSLGGQVKTSFKEKNGYKDKKGKYVQCRPSYRQNIVYHDCSDLFRLYRKKYRCRPKKKPINRNIKSIEYVGLQECQCIRLDDEFGLYLTDEFIVTHNTQPHLLWILQIACNEDPNWNWDEGVDGKNFWWVAPVSSQAGIAFRRLEGMLKGVEGFKMYRAIGKERIETPLGSTIWFKSAENPDSLYGEDVYGAVLDEHSRCKQKAWLALYSTLTATGGPAKLIGNYTGSSSWSSILKSEKEEDGDPQWYTATIPATMAIEHGILEQEVVDQAEKDFPSADFKALYMCEGSVDKYRIFNELKVGELFTNDHVLMNNVDEKYMVCDLAYLGVDFFVIHIWSGNVLIRILKFERTGGSEIVGHIQRLADEYGIKVENIVVDATGADWLSSSDGQSGYLDGVVMFKGASTADDPETYYNQRAEKFYKLASAVKANKLYCQDDSSKTDMIAQLNAQRRKDHPKGKIQMETKKKISALLKGKSPDDADTLSMRMVFPIDNYKINLLSKGSNEVWNAAI